MILKIIYKRFAAGLCLGDGLKEKIKAALGLVLISRISPLTFVMKENGQSTKVHFKNGSDAAMWTEVFYNREYRLPPYVRPQKILDLGANVGFTSLYFSLHYPGAHIIAVEPDPQNLPTLELNLSNKPDIVIVPKAIDTKTRKRDLYLSQGSGMKSSFFSFHHAQKTEVQSVTVDEVLSYMKWDKVDLIKFDIEGAEWELFQRFPFKIANFFIGEYHEDITQKPVSEFIALFKDFNAKVQPLSKNRFSLFFSRK